MNHSVKSMMFLGAFLFGLVMCFTSCEDILGHWEKPAPAEVTPGPLAGKFTINASGDKVQFSQGNLRATYDGTKWTWAFAKQQWDYVGNAEGNTKVSDTTPFVAGYSGSATTVDLFGWVGASCTWTGAAQFGITSSVSWNATDGYGTGSTEALKSDWGNTIGTGWRTLTSAEWTYLFDTRTTTSGVLYAKAKVNEVNGVILLPDDWDASYYALTSPNTGTANYTTNEITSANWTDKLEAHGAVFLPAAGYRKGTVVSDAGTEGCYWSSTAQDAIRAYYAYFGSNELTPAQFAVRYNGLSVRLVRAAE